MKIDNELGGLGGQIDSGGEIFETKLDHTLEEAIVLIGTSMLEENLKNECLKVLKDLKSAVKNKTLQMDNDRLIRSTVLRLLNILDDNSEDSEKTQLFNSLRDLLWKVVSPE